MSLACKNLTLAVAGRTLCRNLAMTVQPGEVWGVLGPNGGGKTTLINTLAGLAAPATGEVSLHGHAIAGMTTLARARAVGVLHQHEDSEFWGSVIDYVLLGRFPHAPSLFAASGDDAAVAQSALAQVGLAAFAQRRYATLSGGERQRVRVAQLLAQAPQFLLLDEPLQHLDLRYQMQLLQLLATLARDQQRGVVLVLHDVLWPARLCTHALLLDGAGGACAGDASDILTQVNLETLFGCALQPAGDKSGAGFVPAL